MEVHEVAREVVWDRHPDARAAFLGGSVLTEHRTATSDLDVVVLLKGEPAPYRESLFHEGWPVELFVHTEESWHEFTGREVRRRRSPLLWMCASGALLFDADGVGGRIATEAKRFVETGPPAVETEELEDARYSLTDLLDDLRGCREPGERLFIVTELVNRVGQLTLLNRGSWLGGGKWLGRRLDEHAPGVSRQLDACVQQALRGEVQPLIALAEELLIEAGGPLWAGYRRGGPT
ncbi:nucleotidyltransferase domain-containing protein [Streptomyces sp. NPDC021622]|uniref:nucleotidyltransferase domain-containing protein n=1 Tax=Streptomyces sp. NPDC021622 TaxID=3155013 RepID=UPI0033FFC4E3